MPLDAGKSGATQKASSSWSYRPIGSTAAGCGPGNHRTVYADDLQVITKESLTSPVWAAPEPLIQDIEDSLREILTPADVTPRAFSRSAARLEQNAVLSADLWIGDIEAVERRTTVATKTGLLTEVETNALPLVEVVRLSDRKPAEPSQTRIREAEAHLLKSPFHTTDD